MSIIKLHSRLRTDVDLLALNNIPWAGSFNTDTATWWGSDSSTTRVWLTPSGRWVLTSTDWDCYITEDEARGFLDENGHRDAVLAHIDVPRATRGRPEVGPEVKVRLPESTIAAVDSMATTNGLTRAGQLRSMIMDIAYLAD